MSPRSFFCKRRSPRKSTLQYVRSQLCTTLTTRTLHAHTQVVVQTRQEAFAVHYPLCRRNRKTLLPNSQSQGIETPGVIEGAGFQHHILDWERKPLPQARQQLVWRRHAAKGGQEDTYTAQ